MNNQSNNCFVSWSGGKDCCLALYKATQLGYNAKMLFTMFSMDNGVSSAHRVGEQIIKEQAEAIGIEHRCGRAFFNDYEEVFKTNLNQFKKQGIDVGIFGDIDLQAHKDWEDNVCKSASIVALLPLWKMERYDVLTEFMDAGFKSKIVIVNTTMMDTSFLGRDLDKEILADFEQAGIDVCGENGEYHTIVYDGPIFNKPLKLKWGIEVIPIEEKWARISVDI